MNAVRLITALVLILVHVPLAHAHLSIIRQGPESRGGIESDDHAGAALAVGDFNGDGFDDLAVGAPDEDLGSFDDAGAVIVSWGSSSGITHVNAQLLTLAGLGHADQGGARFGAALAAGDINRDGRDDLVIGAPLEDIGLTTNAGRFYVVYGSSTGLGSLASGYDQSSAGGSIEVNDQFGSSLAVANFNGDSNAFADIAVGAPGEDAGAGAVALNYFGTNLGLSTSSAVFVKQSGLGGTNDAGDRFGEALAAGNLIGSVHVELAIGSPGNGGDLFTETGTVWVLPGSSAGTTTAGAIELDALDVGGTIQSNARFGSALATGRLYSGTYRSLAIGEPNRAVTPYAEAGRVYVVEGGTSNFDYPASLRLTKYSAGVSVASNEHFGATLATGDWAGTGGLEELAVGVPDDHLGGASDGVGSVVLFAGDTNGPASALDQLTQAEHGDDSEGGDRYGAAIAFGRFDDTNQGALAIGSPGEWNETPIYAPVSFAVEAGAVHVVAPWRQVQNPRCHSALITDCAGQPVYSLKPFEQVKIASTTKLMTLLLAAERIQSGAYTMESPYQVPPWAADSVVGGSLSVPPLMVAETLDLRGLLTYMIFHSGNDATYCAADLLEGGGGQFLPQTFVGNVQNFVGDMNVKAAELGMFRTQFTSPNGFDSPLWWIDVAGDHHSTAWDMMLLMRAGMQNPVFKDVAGRESLTVMRNDMPALVKYGWDVVQLDKVDAGKPGGTPLGQTTGVFDGYDPLFGHVVGTSFGHPSVADQVNDAVELLNIGFGACGISPIFANPAPFQALLAGASTASGSKRAFGANPRQGGDVYVDLCRETGSQPTSARMEIGRHSEVKLEAGELATFGIRPFQAHAGYRIANSTASAIRLRLTPSAGPGAGIVTIPPNGILDLAPYAATLATYTLMIQNAEATGTAAHFTVTEQYEHTFSAIPVQAGPFHTWRLFRDGLVTNDGVWMVVHGLDLSRHAGTLYALAHEGDSAVDVTLPPTPIETAVVRLSATPNPSRAHTRFAIDVPMATDLRVRIYDIAGREVAGVDAGRIAAGRWTWDWDGVSRGAPVGSGIYFARVLADGREVASTRITRLR